MSDETFFREVNEEIRQQRVHDIWKRFGRLILGAAVLAVIATIAYVVWREYRTSAANAAGDRFITAVDLADAGKADEAATQLDAIGRDGAGAYRQLADLRLAAIRLQEGDAKAALDGFNKVADDANAPDPLRDLAALRAAYVLVDTGSFEDVRMRVERLTNDNQPLRFMARDALGLAAWKTGNLDEAKRFLQPNADDTQAPAGITVRTRVLLDLIAAGTTPESAAAAAAAAPPPTVEAPAAPLADTPIPLDLTSPPGPEMAPTAPEAPEAAPAPLAPPTDAEPAPLAPQAPLAPPASN